MNRTQDGAHRPDADDAVARHALALAGQLSDTVRRERATARRLAEYLATRTADGPRGDSPTAGRRGSNGVRLTCTACDVTVQAPVDDLDGTVDQAQSFFSEHDRCRCEIDLTDTAEQSRRVWARES